jgi:hypothetical protein
MAKTFLAHLAKGHVSFCHHLASIVRLLFLVTAAILNGGAELSDTILKWDYPRTIPANFGLIWFSGFRGEDLNAIFYQNMPNLHNLYKSDERKMFTEKLGLYVKLLTTMYKIMSDSPALHSRWLLLLKIENSWIAHCCFIINLNELKFLLQLHGNE